MYNREYVKIINDSVTELDNIISKLEGIKVDDDSELVNLIVKLHKDYDALANLSIRLNNKLKYSVMSDRPLDVKLVESGIDYNLYCNLKRAGIHTLGDIIDRGLVGLSRIRNIGDRSIQKISDVCKIYGLELK